jgi:hypothetical protein
MFIIRSHIKNTEKGKLRFFSNEQEMNQQQEAINTNCINHTQDWTLENTHSHKELEIWNNLTSKVVTAPTTMSFESRRDLLYAKVGNFNFPSRSS